MQLLHKQKVKSTANDDNKIIQYKMLQYKFDKEAQELFNNIFSEYRLVSRDMNGIDTFIRLVVTVIFYFF